MDIKAGRDNYSAAAGVKDIKISEIEESAEFLLEGSVPYEFRTTAVKGIHSIRDFMDIGEWLAGCSHYYLQNYADSGQVLCSGFQPFSKGELDQFFNVLKPLIPNALLRGIDN